MHTELIDPQNVQRAADLLKKGELIAFPTETVYGIGALIDKPEALQNIYKVKGRPQDNPLIVHISDQEQVAALALEIPRSFYLLAEHFWPGPLTLLLKKHPDVSFVVTAGLETIAIRMPSHPIAQELLQRAGQPIAAPSANLSGRPSATNPKHVLDDFNTKIAAVIDGGECPLGIESTVLSLLDENHPLLLRPGSITQAELESVLAKKVYLLDKTALKDEKPLSPGMKYRHYAPNIPVKLFDDFSNLSLYIKKLPPYKRCIFSMCDPLLFAAEEFAACDYFALSAKNLYMNLRLAEQAGYVEILVLCDKDVQRDIALMNRLSKAASAEDSMK